MLDWLKKTCYTPVTPQWSLKLAASLIVPALILWLKPLGMNGSQSATVAGVLLAIIWWTSGIVKKIPASLFLLAWFCVFSGAPAKTIFTFPLGETFLMLVITYLFSQAIGNSGILDRILLPLIMRIAKTPIRCILAVILTLYLTMYVVPQPMARLVLVAVVFDTFLRRTTLNSESRQVIMYSVFVFYALVNMSCKDADLIMNYVASSASGAEITNGMWTRAMAVPALGYIAVVLAVFLFLFHRHVFGLRVELLPGTDASFTGFRGRELAPVIVVAATVVLWMTNSLWDHGIQLFGYISGNTLVTIVATVILFALGVLGKKDFSAIDVVTLVFLSAAMAIGGVLKACGAADIVFGRLAGILPETFSVWYLLVMVLVGMMLHMVLGSNTTTLSVIVPGLIMICGGMVNAEVVVYTSIISVAFHAILPFHSVAIMIGVSNNYFPSRYVSRLGLAVTPVVFLSAALIFLPYWKLIGLI